MRGPESTRVMVPKKRNLKGHCRRKMVVCRETSLVALVKGALASEKPTWGRFFGRPFWPGLTNYVIRHCSIYSNMTSSASFAWARLRGLTCNAHPILRPLLKVYTLKVVLDMA